MLQICEYFTPIIQSQQIAVIVISVPNVSSCSPFRAPRSHWGVKFFKSNVFNCRVLLYLERASVIPNGR